MRIFFASDLHVDAPGNAAFVRDLAALARDESPDAIVIAGDVCNGVSGLARVLATFAKAAPYRLYVPGNHELWSYGDDGPGARERYYRELPRVAMDSGFHPLVTEPFIAADVAFAGTMGWYDYSFADPGDGASDDEIARKSKDGLEWMDRRYVRWRDSDGNAMSDPEVSALLVEDLRTQLESLADAAARRIVVVTHHIPDPALAPPVFTSGHLRYFRAFLGSTALGDLLRADPRIALLYCGHVHSIRDAVIGGVPARTCPVGYPRERKDGVRPQDRRLLLDV